MVRTKTIGGIFVGIAVAFGGILFLTIQSLTTKNQVLGCVVNTPGCQQVATGLGVSHLATGFLTAILSLGIYFLVFHKDTVGQVLAEQQRRKSMEEQVALLTRVMTEGEAAILRTVVKEDGILQSTLAYRTNLTPGRISQVLSSFEEQGVIKRIPAGKTYRVHNAL